MNITKIEILKDQMYTRMVTRCPVTVTINVLGESHIIEGVLKETTYEDEFGGHAWCDYEVKLKQYVPQEETTIILNAILDHMDGKDLANTNGLVAVDSDD